MAMAAGIMAAGSLVGGLLSSNAASNAASTQANAANNAMNMSQAQWQQVRQGLMPYMNAGQGATNSLMGNLGALTAPFNPNMQQLEATPGYQFDLQQGLESTQNGFAAKGLGVSGASMKGAADYANGLAQNTYAQQAQIYYQNQQNAYNKLMGVSQLGENAAAGTGQIGQGYLNTSTNAMMGSANASAAGDIAGANAWSNALAGVGNASGMYAISQNPQLMALLLSGH